MKTTSTKHNKGRQHARPLEIFTDGSFRNGVGGWAFIAGDGTKHGGYRTKVAAGPHHVELEAIVQSAEWARKKGHKKVVVRSDAKTVVQVLNRSKKSLRGYVHRQQDKHTKALLKRWIAATKGDQLVMQVCWVKGHSGIEGNEAADKYAGEMRAIGEHCAEKAQSK